MKVPLEQTDGAVSAGSTTSVALPPPVAATAPLRARLLDYVELTKPRISVMVLFVTAIGYAMGASGAAGIVTLGLAGLIHTLVGVALVAAGANTLNQVMERDYDRLMPRTRNRPVAAGRLGAAEAAAFGTAAALVGTTYLALVVNFLSAGLAATTLLLYLLAYTPLKRRTIYNTLVGAVPGALPPLIGFAAARASLPPTAWTLFAILFVWQLPHFFAIAWMYRDDYALGGYRMLSWSDVDGRRTGRWIVGYSIVLLVVSLIPWMIHFASGAYAIGAAVLGIGLSGVGLGVSRRRTTASARRMLLASIAYLPIIFMLLYVFRIRG